MRNSRNYFLILTVIGAFVPLIPGWRFLATHGFDLPLLLTLATTNEIASAVLADISFTATIFWIWAYCEMPKIGLSRRWILAIIPITLWAVCAGFPFYLFLRQKALNHAPQPEI